MSLTEENKLLPQQEGPPFFSERAGQAMNNMNKTRRNQRRDAKIEETEERSTFYLGDGSMKSPIEFREWFKILFRVWRPNLSPNEFLVAQFIFDRTAG